MSSGIARTLEHADGLAVFCAVIAVVAEDFASTMTDSIDRAPTAVASESSVAAEWPCNFLSPLSMVSLHTKLLVLSQLFLSK